MRLTARVVCSGSCPAKGTRECFPFHCQAETSAVLGNGGRTMLTEGHVWMPRFLLLTGDLYCFGEWWSHLAHRRARVDASFSVADWRPVPLSWMPVAPCSTAAPHADLAHRLNSVHFSRLDSSQTCQFHYETPRRHQRKTWPSTGSTVALLSDTFCHFFSDRGVCRRWSGSGLNNLSCPLSLLHSIRWHRVARQTTTLFPVKLDL